MDTVTGNPDGSSRFRLSHQGVAVAVRLATEPDDPAVVHDTVDDRGGHVAVAENLAPPAQPCLSAIQIRPEPKVLPLPSKIERIRRRSRA